MLLKNAVAVITGAGKGVGATTAKLLASRGCHVVINYSKSEQEARATQEVCKSFGVKTLVYQADVAEEEQCRAMVDQTIKDLGKIDILINNAGVTKFASYDKLDALSTEDFERIFRVNVFAAYTMAKLAAPYMQEQGNGLIVNVSSAAGKSGLGSSIAYATSKGALNTLTKSLAKALAPVRVNAILPSFIDSTWWAQRFTDEAKFELFKKEQAASNLLNRVIKPEDIANTVLYLAENDAITGELIRLDAGSHIGRAPKKPEAAASSTPRPSA